MYTCAHWSRNHADTKISGHRPQCTGLLYRFTLVAADIDIKRWEKLRSGKTEMRKERECGNSGEIETGGNWKYWNMKRLARLFESVLLHSTPTCMICKCRTWVEGGELLGHLEPLEPRGHQKRSLEDTETDQDELHLCTHTRYTVARISHRGWKCQELTMEANVWFLRVSARCLLQGS